MLKSIRCVVAAAGFFKERKSKRLIASKQLSQEIGINERQVTGYASEFERVNEQESRLL